MLIGFSKSQASPF
ncbi:hypothetical protein LEMLEM_LOCUS21199 [Lemmus lemmus]